MSAQLIMRLDNVRYDKQDSHESHMLELKFGSAAGGN